MNQGIPNSKLDLKGVVCPMNFVKAKLKLEAMNRGELLEVILDDGDPVVNVSASIKDEGHKIIAAEKVNGRWKLLIEKS